MQARLGHVSATETLATYAHVWPDSEDRTREAVDSILGPVVWPRSGRDRRIQSWSEVQMTVRRPVGGEMARTNLLAGPSRRNNHLTRDFIVRP